MLHIDHDTKYYWYQDVADFRKGFAGLSGLVREHMRKEVTDGGVFIFVTDGAMPSSCSNGITMDWRSITNDWNADCLRLP